MNKFLGLGAVLALVAACDQRPAGGGGGGGDGGGDGGDPPVTVGTTQTVGDLQSATYDSGTLTIRIAMDGQDVDQDYGAGSPLGDFELFTLTEGTTGRAFTAVAGEVDGQVSAVIVSDGGQFNRYFGGGQVVQVSYTAPDGGITDYEGQYVGLLNFGPEANDPFPGEEGDESYASLLVEGQTFLKVDFGSGYLNGFIYGRTTDEGNIDLPNVILTDGVLAADGSFSGVAENVDQAGIGSFQGVVGGDGGTSVAGLVELSAPFLAEVPAFVDVINGSEAEVGMFILTPVGP